MDRLAAMETYVQVVDAGSFSAAARRLKIGQSAVSKTIAQLEAWLGVHLLLRSTRSLRPTDAGLAFYERARRTIQEASEAESAARSLEEAGFGEDHISLLTPGVSQSELDDVPTTETEQPGMGRAVGGVVGAALGIAGGLELGTALASLMVPGVGPIVASGIAAATIFGAGGAIGGAAAGEALENETTHGLPEDEIYVYKDALRQGRGGQAYQPEDRFHIEPSTV